MNTAALSSYIGKEASLLEPDGLSFSVRIADAKVSYGRVRFFVVPVSGSGTVWVDISRIRFADEKEAGK